MRTLHSLTESNPHADCIAKSESFAYWYRYFLSVGYTDLFAHTLAHGSALVHPSFYANPYPYPGPYSNGDTLTVTYPANATATERGLIHRAGGSGTVNEQYQRYVDFVENSGGLRRWYGSTNPESGQ